MEQRVGHWKIEEKIGNGFSCVVYRAVNLYTKELAAVKEINPKAIAAQYKGLSLNQVVKRIQNEVGILLELEHPGIPTFFDIRRGPEKIYMCMGFAKGRRLLECLRLEGLPLDRVTVVMKQILEAVAYLHQKHIAHGDLKLENIMIDESSDRITVIDFGFSARMRSDGTAKVIGWTPQYAPPESFAQFVLTKMWDMWTCGVIMYLLITSKFPFPSSIDWGNLKEKFVPVSFPLHTPSTVVLFVMEMLKASPQQRATAATALESELFILPDGSPSSSSTSSADNFDYSISS